FDAAAPINSLPSTLTRYQFDNHLGSASLELDYQAQIISYEEYYPYGSTSYQALRSQTEAAKRHRYTGKEHDGETGLYYHGARYYTPWLGRWASCEPGGLLDGVNLYRYCKNAPPNCIDPTGFDPVRKNVASMTSEQLNASYAAAPKSEAKQVAAG